MDVQVGSSCVIEAVPRSVAADQSNANKEAHTACSVAKWQDHLRCFRAWIGESQARCAYFSRLKKKTCLCNWPFVASFLGKADASSTSFCLLQALFNATKKKNCARPAFRLTVAHYKWVQAEGFAIALSMPRWRTLSPKTVTRRFAKLLANLHWTAVNVIDAIATNRNNNWRPAPAKGLVKSGCVIDPFTQLASDRLLTAFFDNATLKVMLTSQRRELWLGTKKIITQAERCLKKAAANDGNELQAVCTKLPTLCTKLPTIWSGGSISATPRPTNTNEVLTESFLPAHSIHASLDVIWSTPSSLHCEKRAKVTWMVILGWTKRPPGPFTCMQARIAAPHPMHVLRLYE